MSVQILGDFLDFKQFEPGMRYLIDNYIVADDAEKIAMFDDFTLLDFIIGQEEKFDEIVEFAELDGFMDEKVKNFSAPAFRCNGGRDIRDVSQLLEWNRSCRLIS